MKKIKELVNVGNEIGLHGYNHYWLGRLHKDEQKKEITNIFEHRYKFSNWDGSYYPEGMDDDEEWTGKIL